MKTSFIQEAEKLGLTATVISGERRKNRPVSDTVPLIEKGTCGVFLDVRYQYGKGNYGETTGVKGIPLSGRLASRINNQLQRLCIRGVDYIIKTDYSSTGVRDPQIIRDIEEVHTLTQGRLVPVLVRPYFGDIKDQVQLNSQVVAKRIGRALAQSSLSFIESHL
jgi:hypothetical protein